MRYIVLLCVLIFGSALLSGLACDDSDDEISVVAGIPTVTTVPTIIASGTPTATATPTIQGTPLPGLVPVVTVTPPAPVVPVNSGTPTSIPVNPSGACASDRDAIQVALDAYYAENSKWPTIDGQPGDIAWIKLVPDLLNGIPWTDSKCEWQVNSSPEGAICLLTPC